MHMERGRGGILIEDTEKTTWKWKIMKTFSLIKCLPTGLLEDQSIAYAVYYCSPHPQCALTTPPTPPPSKNDEAKTYKKDMSGRDLKDPLQLSFLTVKMRSRGDLAVPHLGSTQVLLFQLLQWKSAFYTARRDSWEARGQTWDPGSLGSNLSSESQLCWFVEAGITSYHKLAELKQWKFIFSLARRPEVKIKGYVGRTPFRGSIGKKNFIVSFSDLLLTVSKFFTVYHTDMWLYSVSIFASPSSWCLCVSYSFAEMQDFVSTLRTSRSLTNFIFLFKDFYFTIKILWGCGWR